MTTNQSATAEDIRDELIAGMPEGFTDLFDMADPDGPGPLFAALGAVLAETAIDRLDDLREEARFRPWFYAVLLSVHRARARRHFWRRFLPLPPHHGDAPRPADLGPDAEDVAGRAARVNRRSKFAVVRAAKSWRLRPKTGAIARAVWAT